MIKNLNENIFKKPQGHIAVTMFKGKYDLKTGKIDGEILKQYDEHNLIVNQASALMAARMAPDSSIPRITSESTTDENGTITSTSSHINDTNYPLQYGFQYLALGSGQLDNYASDSDKANYLYKAESSVDTEYMQSLTQLENELIRNKITSWSFMDTNNDISDTQTNILKLTTLFDENNEEFKALYGKFIVEMGLFGGNATDERNSGHLFNYKLFNSWNLIEGSSLLINWIITF